LNCNGSFGWIERIRRMALAPRTEVLQLYRSLLRIARRWPVDEDRPGRSLREYAVSMVKTRFNEVGGFILSQFPTWSVQCLNKDLPVCL